jgi:hypothetical protein
MYRCPKLGDVTPHEARRSNAAREARFDERRTRGSVDVTRAKIDLFSSELDEREHRAQREREQGQATQNATACRIRNHAPPRSTRSNMTILKVVFIS